MSAKPWLSCYPDGVAPDVDPDKFSSVNDLLDDIFERYALRPAFTNRGTEISFERADTDSRALAAYLQALPHLSRGDRVAIMMPNLLQTPIAVFGVLRAGLTVVNVNPLYTPRELEHQLSDSGAKAIIVLENFIQTVVEVIGQTDLEHVIVTSVGDAHSLVKRMAVDLIVRHVRRLVPDWHLRNAAGWRDVLKRGRRLQFRRLDIDSADDAFLQYTGGTTGVSKGAQLTHRNIVSNVLQMATWAKPFFDGKDGVVVTPLPLYHVFALTVNLFGFALLGGHNLLITDPRDLRGLVADLRRHRFTAMTGVNTLFNALLHEPRFADLDFSEFKICLAGGMAVQRDVAERWRAVTGTTIAQGYGLTEASPVVSANPLNATAFNGSVGLPLPSTDVEIRDDDGTALPVDEIGEICVHGPQVMKGYWGRPGDTADVMFPGDWLKTGDIGRFDEHGYLYIEDRKKDVIVTSGFKIFPSEVEDVIMLHPGVLEVAAVGVADADSGEVVKVYVVKKDADLTEADLLAHCRRAMTGYKIPRIVEFLDELPKSNVGKVLRRELRDGANA